MWLTKSILVTHKSCNQFQPVTVICDKWQQKHPRYFKCIGITHKLHYSQASKVPSIAMLLVKLISYHICCFVMTFLNYNTCCWHYYCASIVNMTTKDIISCLVGSLLSLCQVKWKIQEAIKRTSKIISYSCRRIGIYPTDKWLSYVLCS